jgi:hypothetical protein
MAEVTHINFLETKHVLCSALKLITFDFIAY